MGQHINVTIAYGLDLGYEENHEIDCEVLEAIEEENENLELLFYGYCDYPSNAIILARTSRNEYEGVAIDVYPLEDIRPSEIQELIAVAEKLGVEKNITYFAFPSHG